jgi:hypothetical protein
VQWISFDGAFEVRGLWDWGEFLRYFFHELFVHFILGKDQPTSSLEREGGQNVRNGSIAVLDQHRKFQETANLNGEQFVLVQYKQNADDINST